MKSKLLYAGIIGLGLASCQAPLAERFTLSFEKSETGNFGTLRDQGIVFSDLSGRAEILDNKAHSGEKSLHLTGGADSLLYITKEGLEAEVSNVSFHLERWTSRKPFYFALEQKHNDEWVTLSSLDDQTNVGGFTNFINAELLEDFDSLRIRVEAPESSGIIVDDFSFITKGKQSITSLSQNIPVAPILLERKQNKLAQVVVDAIGTEQAGSISEIVFDLSSNMPLDQMKNLKVVYQNPLDNGGEDVVFATVSEASEKMVFKGDFALNNGQNAFGLFAEMDANTSIDTKINATCSSIVVDGEASVPALKDTPNTHQYVGHLLRAHNQDNSDTYRIPGLATTNEGSLIAVYDNRYLSGVDLQANVDVGMSRSTDGGQTWEPMQVIMDMKEWGGLPEDQNGIGDPAVLVDRATNTIWVAAVWAHGHPGQRNWWASKPGLSPKTTSQFVLVKSEDDGKTWSAPINITKQIKDPKWHLLLQGPGKGITMKDGTLVFPAQFKDEKQVPYSTMIYSKNHGKTWHIGTGAKSNTTEAQLVELSNGDIMLNMRDNRNRGTKGENNGRAVAVTSDLGKTWEVHESSNRLLKEPTCMASLISHEMEVDGEVKNVLFFSNPDNQYRRANISIKASLDEGKSWPYVLEINRPSGAGYSCMTVIDDEHVGILYEGVKELYFERIPIADIIKN